MEESRERRGLPPKIRTEVTNWNFKLFYWYSAYAYKLNRWHVPWKFYWSKEMDSENGIFYQKTREYILWNRELTKIILAFNERCPHKTPNLSEIVLHIIHSIYRRLKCFFSYIDYVRIIFTYRHYRHLAVCQNARHSSVFKSRWVQIFKIDVINL